MSAGDDAEHSRFYEGVGERLRELVRSPQSKVLVSEAAQIAGCSEGQLRRYFNGAQIPAHVVVEIARATNADVL